MYKTSSISVAAYLYTRKELKFVGTDSKNPREIVFAFEPQDKAEPFVNEYFENKGSVAPLEFMNAYRALKDLVLETRRTRTPYKSKN